MNNLGIRLCLSRLLLLISGLLLFLLLSCYAKSGSCNLLDQESVTSLSRNIFSNPTSSPLNWNVSIDCCYWEGISCDDYGSVIRLWLPSRGLKGTLSPSIGNLTRLIQLNLSGNSISGPVPDGVFSSLNHLQVVDLSVNHFSGVLDSSDSLPSSIKILDLSSNELEGKIQASFFQKAVNLMNLNLSYNGFVGSFPSSICNVLPSISVLDFSFNRFEGSLDGFGTRCSDNLRLLRAGFNSFTGFLPDDLYALTNLQHLYLPGNRFSGTIGESIGNLLSLKMLALHANNFTGAIPWSIGKLSKLEILLLYLNNLNGTLPVSLRNCSRLITLNLRNNSITGQLSSFDFSKFQQLEIIDLGNNLFKGRFPETLTSCLSLTAIRLSVNQLVGEIPVEIQGLQSLSFFSVSVNRLVNIKGAISILSGCSNLSILIISDNFFNESFPDTGDLVDFHGFKNLQLLGIGGCQFNGEIPNWFSELPKLKAIDVSYNRFTGKIPGWFGNLPSLFYLDLSHNFLSGIFPTELTRLPRLLLSQNVLNPNQHFALELPVFIGPDNLSAMLYNKINHLPAAVYLNNNMIKGAIPTEIGNLKLVQVLDLSNNEFSGYIPDSISQLTNLEKLDLSGNHLQGRIPASLRNLYFLSGFSVAYNNLEGPVPTGGQLDTFPNSSFEGNPGLCGEILNRTCFKIVVHQQPDTKKATNWFTFDSGFGLGFGLSFIATVLIFAARSSSYLKSHPTYVLGLFESTFTLRQVSPFPE